MTVSLALPGRVDIRVIYLQRISIVSLPVISRLCAIERREESVTFVRERDHMMVRNINK